MRSSAVLSFLIVALITVSLVGQLFGEQFEDAQAAHNQGDYLTEVKILRSLAVQGNLQAQLKLGHMYSEGQSLPQDYTEAANWFKKAAEQGDAEGQYYIGIAYQLGKGIPQDYYEAMTWILKSAQQGYAIAQFVLGHMYSDGEGVPQDYVLAHMWFNLAASRSPLGELDKNQIASKMTPSEIAEAQKMAQEWKPKVEREKMGH